jgi:sugar lactone lactonase YvrE
MLRTTLLMLIPLGIFAQDFSTLKVEEVATGFAGGEGPVWSRQGFLLFSDYDKNRIYKYTPGKTRYTGKAPTAQMETPWIGKGVSTPASTGNAESPAQTRKDT